MATATERRERPILFSGPMVRAIREGRKTQTRRVIRSPEKYTGIRECGFCCPHGQPGDRLWVRETWAEDYGTKDDTGRDPDAIWYRADGEARFCDLHSRTMTGESWNGGVQEAEAQVEVQGGWRPSIFMPRWASRLTLEITSVRVERVQEISQEDAMAEGVYVFLTELDGRAYDNFEKVWCRATRRIDPQSGAATPRGAFNALWNKLNDKRGHGWETNPWVWAISFRRVEG